MLPLESIRPLFAHMEWADATVWTSVLAEPRTAGDVVLRDRLHHIHLVQRAFLSIWTGTAPEFLEPSSFADLAGLCRWGRDYQPKVKEFLASVGEASLDQPMALPWTDMIMARIGRSPETAMLAETMFQVTSHSTYHRGQVNTRLRELGGEPPLVDFIVWVWLGKPDANWPG
ncbi:MAG TPA: DinB family protein [Thermoanaerobaculia bacterium]|nr:DinB family protein [Thermoanaerobaculia bacterium]